MIFFLEFLEGKVKSVTYTNISRKPEVFPEDRVVVDLVTSRVQKQSRNYRVINFSLTVFIKKKRTCQCYGTTRYQFCQLKTTVSLSELLQL